MPNTRGIRAGRAFVELGVNDRLTRGLRRAQRQLRAFGQSVRGIGARLAAVSGAVAAGFGLSTRVFAGFDDRMRVAAIRMSDRIWQDGFPEQLGKFMVGDEQTSELFLEVFSHQALGIRRAFLSLNLDIDREFTARTEAPDRLDALSTPTWILFGADDPYLNSGVAEDLHEQIPGSGLELLEDAGHYVQIDRPAEVVRTVLEAVSSASE